MLPSFIGVTCGNCRTDVAYSMIGSACTGASLFIVGNCGTLMTEAGLDILETAEITSTCSSAMPPTDGDLMALVACGALMILRFDFLWPGFSPWMIWGGSALAGMSFIVSAII